MSLVGSLEDLCLADILQIVSLSRKSGLMLIHSDEGEGRIVFCDGLVRAAFVKEEATDLRGLLVANGFLPETQFDRAVELADARGDALDEIIPSCTDLSKERLDSLRREHIERAVFRIFSWQGGEFSFEVCDEVDTRDSEILLPMGINPEYLSMEAARLADESERGEKECLESDSAPEEESIFSGDDLVVQPPEAPAPVEPAASSPVELRGCVVAIDSELATLEWQKAQLRETFERVHIFQSGGSGTNRIRQYLGRGQTPIVLISADLKADPSIGISGGAELVSRLKRQTPSMPVFITASDVEDASACIDDADGLVIRPHSQTLACQRYWGKLGEEAERFREQVVACIEGVKRTDSGS